MMSEMEDTKERLERPKKAGWIRNNSQSALPGQQLFSYLALRGIMIRMTLLLTLSSAAYRWPQAA
jgi:hypothetical protein